VSPQATPLPENPARSLPATTFPVIRAVGLMEWTAPYMAVSFLYPPRPLLCSAPRFVFQKIADITSVWFRRTRSATASIRIAGSIARKMITPSIVTSLQPSNSMPCEYPRLKATFRTELLGASLSRYVKRSAGRRLFCPWYRISTSSS